MKNGGERINKGGENREVEAVICGLFGRVASCNKYQSCSKTF